MTGATGVRAALERARTAYDRIFYRSNPGNAGDSLINAGFYALADDVGLRFTQIVEPHFDYAEISADDLVIVAGGGGISSHWPFGGRAVRRVTSLPSAALLLPQSLQSADDLLALLRPGDTLFVRDRYSLEYAQSLDVRCALELDHDVAFSATPGVLAGGDRLRPPTGPGDTRRLAGILYHLARARRQEHLDAWRTDSEATGAHTGRWRDDLALLTGFGTRDRDLNLYSARWLTTVVSQYGSVSTDRLHVAVAAMLMGTPVTMHANNYHKIRGVYEYSIADDPARRALVRFADEDRPVTTVEGPS